MNTRLFAYWPTVIAAGQLTVVCGILVGSLGYQFVMGELPCPLCVIQRLGFLMACAGPLGLLRSALRGNCGMLEQARGFALCILGSFLGAEASLRQILLHIVPPDAGYGPPVLGLHLYTWAAIAFGCLIASSAVGLCGLQEKAAALPRSLTNVLTGFVLALAAVIALATFAMEGFAFLLPDDPSRYELFRQFGLTR